MSTATQNKRIEALKLDLFSNDEAVVMSALNKCREAGDASIVEPLIVLYVKSDNSMVRREAADMLSTLKVSKTESAFIHALHSEELRSSRSDILSFMWNSGVQPIDHLPQLVVIAIEGNFRETLECLTLIEGMEGPFPKDDLINSKSQLDKFMEKNPDDDRASLLTDLRNIIESHLIVD